jgi:nitrate reductase cytochrome c-type subunit
MVEILCTHVSKWKNETWCNSSRKVGGWIKVNDGEVNSTMSYCRNFCECPHVPQYNNKKILSMDAQNVTNNLKMNTENI